VQLGYLNSLTFLGGAYFKIITMKYLLLIFLVACGKEKPKEGLRQQPKCQTCVKLWVYDIGKVDTMIKPTEFCDSLPPWLVGDTGQRYNSPTVGAWNG
jgi:hypothetical protein